MEENIEVLEVSKPEQNEQDLKSTEEGFPKKLRTNGIKYKIDKIKRWEEKIKWKDLKYEPKKHKWFSVLWNRMIFSW